MKFSRIKIWQHYQNEEYQPDVKENEELMQQTLLEFLRCQNALIADSPNLLTGNVRIAVSTR